MITSGFLPNGLDRADGLNGHPGTPTPLSMIRVQSSNGATTINGIQMEELPDSPEIERAEQATITHTFRTSWINCLTLIYGLGRGSILVDDQGNYTKILSAKIKHEKADTGLLTIVAEGLSFDLPPDKFSIVPVELGVNILKFPRYFPALNGTLPSSNLYDGLLNQMVIRKLQDYFENTNQQLRDSITQVLYYSLGYPGTVSGGIVTPPTIPPLPNGSTEGIAGTDMAKAAALEIIQKYWRGEETPYMVGYEVRWSVYFTGPQFLNPGGRIENPITQANPGLPDYFWDTSLPGDGSSTIFDKLGAYNPQSFSVNGLPGGAVALSCLRKADQYEWDRTFFRVDKIWWVAANGFWDNEFYGVGNGPQVVTDFLFTTPTANP